MFRLQQGQQAVEQSAAAAGGADGGAALKADAFVAIVRGAM